jgi:hypothetical protein
MNSAQRDVVLRMLLPALAIAVLYFFAFNEHAQLIAANEILEGAKAAAVSPQEIAPVRESLAKLNAEQAEMKQKKLAMDERWTRLTTLRSNTPAQRASALRQLTKMLWDRGLVPYEEAPEAGGSGQGQLPGSFDDVIKKISTTPNGSAPPQARLWRIRFYGRYSDVAATLSLLGDTELALVPVGLTMSEAHPDTDWRMWTLLLWN